MYITCTQDLMRMVKLNPGLFNNFLNNLGVEDEAGLFHSDTPITQDDLCITRGVIFIEKLFANTASLTLAEVIDIVLKAGYNTQYLDATFVSDLKTAFYAAYKYVNGAGVWANPVAGTTAEDIDPYLILGGLLEQIEAVEIP